MSSMPAGWPACSARRRALPTRRAFMAYSVAAASALTGPRATSDVYCLTAAGRSGQNKRIPAIPSLK
jgi:hypothetical protein